MNPARQHFLRKNQAASGGSSLVVTLLIVTVLSIIVAAFLQSMNIERLTARSYANIARAEMAAQAGAEEASHTLLRLFADHPDSATVWESVGNTTCTVAYFKDGTTAAQTANATSNPNRPLVPSQDVFFRPLISGAISQNGSFGHTVKSDALPSLTANNSIDFNSNLASPTGNLVGYLPGNSTQPLRAPWVNLTNDQGRVIARYAFFIEDESFKTNINYAASADRGTASPGTNPSELSLFPLADALKTKVAGSYAGIDKLAFSSNITTTRSAIPVYGKFFEEGQINRAFDVGTFPSLRQDLKYVTTLHSSSLNLSRHGSKRLNLNSAVSNTSNSSVIKTEVDRIVRTIYFHLPKFGQRFYRTGNASTADLDDDSQVTAEHERIYLYKLAANIRDMIDTDHQPTILDNNPPPNPDAAPGFVAGYPVRTPTTSPARAIGFNVAGTLNAPSDAIAYGKEALPFLQEYALRAKTLSFTPAKRSASNPTFSSYSFTLDHYFEFWNLSTKDISLEDLGPNPYLLIYAQPAYDTSGGTSIPEGRDVKIPLADFVNGSGAPLSFPSGAATVLTTDSTPNASLCPDVNAVFRPKAPNSYLDSVGKNYREFTGQTARVADGSPSSVNGWFRVNLVARSTSQTDYQTEMALGNDNGLLEGHTSLPIPANLSINNDNNNRANSNTYFLRGGSLRGSSANLNQVADPRTNAEQLNILRYTSGGNEDQTRYFDNNLSNTSVPAESNFGKPINNFTNLTKWPDRATETTASSNAALAVCLDRPLQSVGELGHVFDPARGINSSAGGINLSRGGGRTLRIGQSDSRPVNPNGLWSGNRTESSAERAAWRLTDIFSTTSDDQLPGRININGVLRDEGLALRSMVAGLVFSNVGGSDPLLAGSTLDVNKFVEAVLNRVAPLSGSVRTSPTPETIFWERGALSELPLFHQGNTLAGKEMSDAKDRAREELVRRMIELVCVKGNTFKVYCVGQAIQTMAGGTLRPISTSTKTLTLRLVPEFQVPPSDQFNPADPAGVIERFKRPKSFRIEVVQ